jgi:hypothetical protein
MHEKCYYQIRGHCQFGKKELALKLSGDESVKRRKSKKHVGLAA